MAFSKEVQDLPNGPWSKQFRSRAAKVREKLGMTLNQLGAAFGFSGAFVHGLLAGKPTHNMHSKHADRVLQVLQGLEVQAGIRTLDSLEIKPKATGDLADLIRHINSMGFSVELKPLKA